LGGLSDYSNIIDITTSVQTIPVAPSSLSATNITQTSLTLNWLDNSANEAGFTVEIATNTGFTANLLSLDVGPNATSLNFTGLSANTRYYFRVAAYNTAGTSPWSRSLSTKTLK